MLLQLEMLQPMWKPTFEARSLKRLGDELERPRKRQSRQSFITEEEVNYQLKQAVESIVSVIELPSPAATPLTRSFQKALLVVGKGKYELCNHYQMPVLQNDHEVMIRTQAVGLNPIDWKSVAYNFCLPQFPWVGSHRTPALHQTPTSWANMELLRSQDEN